MRRFRDLAETVAWLRKVPCVFGQSETAALADEIERLCRREADRMIPAERIEFSDAAGRRTIDVGWVIPQEGGAPRIRLLSPPSSPHASLPKATTTCCSAFSVARLWRCTLCESPTE